MLQKHGESSHGERSIRGISFFSFGDLSSFSLRVAVYGGEKGAEFSEGEGQGEKR